MISFSVSQKVSDVASHHQELCSSFKVLNKPIQGILTVSIAQPIGVIVLLVGTLVFFTKFTDTLQVWLVVAGTIMVSISMAIAYHEVTTKDVEQSIEIFHTEDNCVQHSKGEIMNLKNNIELTPNSCTLELGAMNASNNGLEVVHVGTVMEIQGSQAYIVPHQVAVQGFPHTSKVSRNFNCANGSMFALRLPLVIAFDLGLVLAALRQDIAVGRTVQFSYMHTSISNCTRTDNKPSMFAYNVRPITVKQAWSTTNRRALEVCKHERERLFAEAMVTLKSISPRHDPVQHPLDLIKFAEQNFVDDIKE